MTSATPSLPSQDIASELNRAFAHVNANSLALFQMVHGLRRRLAWSEMDRALRDAERAARLPLELRAQYGEDAVLWDLFTGKLDGVFIEVGAYDGQSFSVSWVFEALGWSGLLVEALPKPVAACRAARPGSRVAHAALSRTGCAPTATFTVAAGSDMLSFLTTDAGHTNRIRAEGLATRTISVPQTTMDELLESGAAPGLPSCAPIDFAVIDVEGGELDLLSGFDLSKHHVRVLVIEDNHGGAHSPLANFMASRPYTQVKHESVNRFYIHNDERELLSRARSMWRT